MQEPPLDIQAQMSIQLEDQNYSNYNSKLAERLNNQEKVMLRQQSIDSFDDSAMAQTEIGTTTLTPAKPIKKSEVLKPRSMGYDWPIVIVYAIILLLLIGVSVAICVCFCDKDKQEK